ncbi:hypothetical protein MMC25_003416 [Agyrium rufum]|nr:hypothetical protein [Agyrium rufum]
MVVDDVPVHGTSVLPGMARLSAHQRLVFTDPVAFRYLEEDPSVTVLARRSELQGYEVYIVEQWACSRVHPTFVITTFTGLSQHKVYVGVLSVPTDEGVWSPRLRVYLKAISEFHARKKETPLGTLMVTNLSSFPSALTVILVPDGGVRNHREDFLVNENLKRLGCSGRAGMTLASPTGTTQAKFLQLFHTSDKIPIHRAVLELVRICQTALTLFDKLAPEYADSLLCDITESSLNDWWTEIGIEYFNIEPSDGIMGPTTVCALLGMLLGARNRLSACGCPVGKDVFDSKATKRGIAYFQKAQKLPRSRRLDRQTLDRLHRVTSKAASSEGWIVPKAVKSTVAELSGKGGEMMMGMVGGRDRAGIAEVESLDFDTFLKFLSGETCRWLWHGKPRKSHGNDLMSELAQEDEMIFSGDENSGYLWSSRKRESVVENDRSRFKWRDDLYNHPQQGSQISLDANEKDPVVRKTVLKSVTGKMNDARSGLGRITNAVGISGLRGHQTRHSKDDDVLQNRNDESSRHDSISEEEEDDDDHISADSAAEHEISKEYSTFHRKDADHPELSTEPYFSLPSMGEVESSNSPFVLTAKPLIRSMESPALRKEGLLGGTARPSGSATLVPTANPNLLRRIRSLPGPTPPTGPSASLPRQLSFGIMDDILCGEIGFGINDSTAPASLDLKGQLARETHRVMEADRLGGLVQQIQNSEAQWVVKCLLGVVDLENRASDHHTDLNSLHFEKAEELESLRHAVSELVNQDTHELLEELRAVEVLGAKLEYEINALQSKVQDCEDGVDEFERQIIDLEVRTVELDGIQVHEESWISALFGRFRRTT